MAGMAQTVIVDRAAVLLGVSRRTVYYWIRAGRLQTVRTLNGSQRVRMDCIEALQRTDVPVSRHLLRPES